MYKLNKHIIVLVLLSIFHFTSISQDIIKDAPITWGKVDTSQFNMELPEFCNDASTVTLCRYGETFIQDGSIDQVETSTNVHVRFKVLERAGVERGNVNVYFWTGTTKRGASKSSSGGAKGGIDGSRIENIEGAVYNIDENGNIEKTELNQEDIFVKDYSDLINNGVVSFALPNVKVGSIVEFRYSRISKYYFFSKEWYFQNEAPCLHSEYRVAYPEDKSYAIYVTGILKNRVEVVESSITNRNYRRDHERIFGYILKDSPGIIDDSYVKSIDNVKTRLILQMNEYYDPSINANVKIVSTWEHLADEMKYHDRFGRQLSKNITMLSGLDDLYSSGTELERLTNCFNHIQNHFDCNGWNSVFVDNNLKTAYESGVGSSVEINLSLAKLLKKADLNPTMALVSTRTHGEINEKYPFLRQFNHAIVIVKIGEKNYYLDASSKVSQVSFPPSNIIDCEAFVIDPDNPEIIKITSDTYYNKFVMYSGAVSLDSIKGKIQSKYKGYAAASERSQILEPLLDYFDNTFNDDKNLYLENPQVFNTTSNNKAFKSQVEFSMENSVTESGSQLYFNPFTVHSDFDNLLISKRRDYPVEFNYKYNITYRYSYTIPDGYTVSEVPENTNSALEDNSVTTLVQYTVYDNNIQINTNLKINKLVFSATEYPYLKQILDLWELKHKELIMLTKKTE